MDRVPEPGGSLYLPKEEFVRNLTTILQDVRIEKNAHFGLPKQAISETRAVRSMAKSFGVPPETTETFLEHEGSSTPKTDEEGYGSRVVSHVNRLLSREGVEREFGKYMIKLLAHDHNVTSTDVNEQASFSVHELARSQYFETQLFFTLGPYLLERFQPHDGWEGLSEKELSWVFGGWARDCMTSLESETHTPPEDQRKDHVHLPFIDDLHIAMKNLHFVLADRGTKPFQYSPSHEAARIIAGGGLAQKLYNKYLYQNVIPALGLDTSAPHRNIPLGPGPGRGKLSR
jgi:hypothetical protein